MNKREIFKIVLFLFGFILLLQSVTYMIRTNGAVKDRFMGFYAEPNDTLDVIMIGSSPVPSCYASPMLWGEFGIKAYPLSTNLQRPKAIKHIIEEARKTQNPSLYIIELRQFTATDESMKENMAYTRGVTDNMKYSLNRIKTIQDLVDEPEEWHEYIFDIFKYHTNWKTIVLPEQITSFRYEKMHPFKGFDINDKVGPSESQDFSYIKDMTAIPPEQEKELIELLEYLEAEQLDALFIVSPYTMTAEKKEMYQYMNEIIARYHYQMLNLNDYYAELTIDFNTDFYDYGGHTNISGAEKCTRFLGKYLEENYNVNAIDSDNHLKSNKTWDLSYKLWMEEAEIAKAKLSDRIKNKDYTVMENE